VRALFADPVALYGVGVGLDLESRFALYVVGLRKCTWCGEPLTFSEMEIDHLIPKSLKGAELVRVLGLHGLPNDFDVDGTRNLVASCRRCNGSKGARIPPDQPIITMMLESAARRALLIERRAQVRMTKREAEDASAKLASYLRDEMDSDAQELLKGLELRFALARSAADQGAEEVTVEIHPAVSLLWNPQGRWRLLKVLGPGTAVVTNGTKVGVVGTDITYECGSCGSYGPWNGARCLTCGRLSDPWD
jgi:hypothetical protein